MIKILPNMDSGTHKTPLCKSQQRSISCAMRKIQNDEFSIRHGHFYSCGFIRRGAIIVYFSTSDFRFFPNQAMVRYTHSFKDFTGKKNYPCSIQELDTIVSVFLECPKHLTNYLF